MKIFTFNVPVEEVWVIEVEAETETEARKKLKEGEGSQTHSFSGSTASKGPELVSVRKGSFYDR